jgi:cytochrome c oxidase subunit III
LSSAHASTLAHHFDSYEQQRESASLGMWLFVSQEIMFFGGLFTTYLMARLRHPHAFAIASSHLDLELGGFNTVVLILSSLTMAFAVRAAQQGKGKRIVAFILATLLLGLVFVGVKAVEYTEKYTEHLIPGQGFHFHLDHHGAELAAKHGLTEETVQAGTEMFFSLYFAMTGLHALHMIIGMVILLFYIRPALRGRYNADYHNPIECFGLYWHFVDIVWIFLFPLLYLLGRH